MAVNLNEEATLTLRANTRDFENELGQLNTQAKTLKSTLKEIETTGAGKGSEEWKKYKAELAAVNVELSKVRKETDLTKLTYGQLQTLVGQLNRDLKATVAGTDNFNAAAKRLAAAEKQLKDVGTQVEKIKKESDGLGQPGLWSRIGGGVGVMTKAFQAFMALQVIQFIVGGFTALIGKFTDFEDAAQSLSAVTGLTGKDLDYLKKQAKETGPQFGMTAAEMLKAYELMGSAKPELLKQKEALAAVTKEAVILSKAGKIDLADAAKVVGESLNQFGKGAESANRFVNVLSAGVKEGSDSITGISTALKQSGSVANAAGLSFEQTNAILAKLSGQAIKGEQAGTGLRNILVKLMAGANETNPAVVGLDKALENLGKQNLSTAELAKRFGLENVVVAQQVVAQRKEIATLTTTMTGTNTAYEQAATNMNSLSESWKRGTAIATGYALSLGEKLAPYVKKAIDFLLEMAKNVEVNAGVWDAFSGIIGDVGDIFGLIVRSIFPNFNAGAITIRGVMQGVSVVFQTVLVPVRLFTASLVALLAGFQAVGSGAKGLVLFLQGDFAGAGKAFEETKQHGLKIKETFSKAFTDIGNGYKKAFADAPKNVMTEAVAATTDLAKKTEGGITAEQKKALEQRRKEAEKARKQAEADEKKHLEEINKANAKALEELAKLETENHIKSIKDEMQREFVKLMAKRDAEAEAILKTLASTELKNKQIAQLDANLQADIARVAGEFAEKKRKKAEEEEKKRLETEKTIIEAERVAHNALLDWQELMAKGNTVKLVAIHRERVTIQYDATVAKLNAEEAAERAKAAREITDKEQLDRAITAIEARYGNERLLAEKKHADEVAKIAQDATNKRIGFWKGASDAFSSLLKGDLNAFVEQGIALVQGEKKVMSEKTKIALAAAEAIGTIAKEAAQFLANLAKARADKAIAEAQRERDEKVRLLNDQIAVEKAGQDAAEAEKQRVTQESNDKIQSIKSQTQQTISSLEQQYRQLSSSEEKRKLDDQLAGYKENAEGKTDAAKQAADDAIDAAQLEAKETIKSAQETEKAAIKSANNEKIEKIDAAEATRDAEIAAINKRKDVDQETRKTLLKEAQDAFDKTKKQAEDEAKLKIENAKDTAKTTIDLAKDTAKTKTELAEDQRDAELKAIDAVKKGDDKAAKEILARAKQDAKDKIALAKDEANKKIDEAEREKREKLKKVEAEKQSRIQNQKELNRSIEQENARAKKIEVEEKTKAWKAQQKADISSALIAGALATIKALASGIWPVNLVFAALSAVMTGIQIAKIKSQPQPQFALGGIPDGPRHGSSYGSSGLAIIDRQTGRERGEMEGGEAIISREQTRANLPIINRMFANARTPGRRSATVDRDALGRMPVGFRDGGLFDAGNWSRPMFLYGGIVGKSKRRFEEGGYVDDGGGSGGGGSSGVDGIGQASADYEESKKQFQQQLKALEDIKAEVQKQGDGQRLSIQNMDSNIRWALNWMQQSQATATNNQTTQLAAGLNALRLSTLTGLTDTRTQLREALDTLNRNLVLTMLRNQVAQDNGSEKIVAELRTGLTTLNRDLQRMMQDQGIRTVQAINLGSLTNQLVLNGVGLRIVAGLDKLYGQNKTDFAELADRLETRLDDQTDRLVTVANRSALTNQLALSSLALKTVTSLTNLQTAAVRSLSNLERTTERSLNDSATRTETSLTDLSDAVTLALSILNRDTGRSLDRLGNRTEYALETSATRTTRSVDSLSVEVRSLKGSINAVEGAVWQVKYATDGVQGAVWGSNANGQLSQLIAVMSTFGG